jgi:hypothetical protein
MYSQVEIMAIFFLISLFVIVNLFHKNITNIVVFVASYIVLERFISDKYNAMLVAYGIGICFGIFKNFHLLENFAVKNNELKETPIQNDKTFQKMNSDPVIKLNPDIKNYVSDKLLKKFMEKLKNEDDTMIYTRKVFIYDLKPSVNELRQGKIRKMKESNITKPIIISSDNFIVDGHHRWYALKMKSMAQNNKSKESEDNYINATIINMKIDSLVNKLKEFKEDYNDNTMSSFKLDETKISRAERDINNIKNSIMNIESYFKDIKKLNLV